MALMQQYQGMRLRHVTCVSATNGDARVVRMRILQYVWWCRCTCETTALTAGNSCSAIGYFVNCIITAACMVCVVTCSVDRQHDHHVQHVDGRDLRWQPARDWALDVCQESHSTLARSAGRARRTDLPGRMRLLHDWHVASCHGQSHQSAVPFHMQQQSGGAIPS